MRVTGAWLDDPRTQSVLHLLTGAGFQAYAVGGCVRNAVLGVPVGDVDIATDALPETVTKLAEMAGIRAVPTGIEHGTVTLVTGGTGFEVTTFRHDAESFGRHARVTFGADLAQDAARRDFTMNALYVDAGGRLLDPLDGLPDLRARRVRFVGDAGERITEDALRILRFFRFTAQYGDPALGMEPEALAACAQHSAMLETLSRERIGAEMRKLLAVPDPAPAVAAMVQTGVMRAILPGATAQALTVLVHLEGGDPGGWLRRLTVLGGADPGDTLRLSKAEKRDFSLVRDAISALDPPAALGFSLGARRAADAVLARAALLETQPPADWRDQIARGAGARFPLRAADLMPRLQGPALGAALKQAQEHWMAQDFRPDRAALLRLLGLA